MANTPQSAFPGTVEQIEHTNNKVTEFTDSVTDKQYPSALLTKTALDKKANNADLYPIGTVYITRTADMDLGALFGGTWRLIDKEFKSVSVTDTANEGLMFSKSDNISAYSVYAIYGGHTIRLRLGFTPTIALNDDSTVEIGNPNLGEFGVESLFHSIMSVPALSDGANGLVMANIDTTGAVVVNDIVKSTTANSGLYINEEITCRYDKMLDSFCDKFYWERIE
jgi:hypothetical protein